MHLIPISSTALSISSVGLQSKEAHRGKYLLTVHEGLLPKRGETAKALLAEPLVAVLQTLFILNN